MRMEKDMLQSWPEFMKALTGLGLAMFGVFTGRIAWHADQVRRGHRQFFSKELLLEIPIIAGVSLLTWGAADYWGLSPGAAAAVGTLAGWLGPRGIEVIVCAWWKKRQR